jgi:hypothetical protein
MERRETGDFLEKLKSLARQGPNCGGVTGLETHGPGVLLTQGQNKISLAPFQARSIGESIESGATVNSPDLPGLENVVYSDDLRTGDYSCRTVVILTGNLATIVCHQHGAKRNREQFDAVTVEAEDMTIFSHSDFA